jgi:hypothetical protein
MKPSVRSPASPMRGLSAYTALVRASTGNEREVWDNR